MSGYEVTKTQRAAQGSWSDLPVHETTNVANLAEAGAGIEWQHVGHGVYYGTANYGRIDLATYIARPVR